MKQVLIVAPISKSFKLFLHEREYELLTERPKDTSTIEGILTTNKLKLNQAEIDRFPMLKWIGRLGSGMEIIDLAYCQQKNIVCVSSPAGIANSVAEHTIGMVLNLLHHIGRAQQEIIEKNQWNREPNRGIELESLTVGLIGYGHTGSAVAHKLSVFCKSILVYDKYKSGFGDEFVQEVSLAQLQAQADIISFHLPLNNETAMYYNDAFVQQCKPHIVVNVSRGAICSTETILNGFKSGKLWGACLDVLEEETNILEVLSQPQNKINELAQYPVILTPHIAGYSMQATEKMSTEIMNQLNQVI